MGMLWSRDILCTHSITGKPSNAFKEKGAKPQLDQGKVKDICGKLLLASSKGTLENIDLLIS